MGRTKSSKKGQPVGGRPACARCEQLQRALDAAQSDLQAAQEREAGLQAQLANLQRSLFGRKSEATPAGGDDPSATATVAADPSADETAAGETPAPDPSASKDPAVRPRRKRGREPGSPTPPREQRPDLPVVFEWLDVPAPERRCPDCGTAYVPCGHKISWLYEMVWNALVRKVVRQRYGPDCDCCSARPVIAPPAPRLGTSQLGTSVWAWCLVQVYALFRPPAAVARDLAALGLRVPQSTLSTGLRRLAHLFEPLDAAIGEYQQQQPVAQADETSWPVQWLATSESDNKDPPPRGRPKPKFWLWACLAGDTARMRILPTRGLDSARQLLDSLVGQGGLIVLVCDCYSTYKAFAKQFPNLVVLSHCWVHIRRNFVWAGTGHPELKAWAQEWVERIGELFQLNRQRLQQWDRQQPLERQSGAFQALQQQLQARVEELFERAREEGGDRKLDWILLDQVGQGRSQHGAELARVDAQGRALGALLSHRESLSRCVADPRIPLDNNLSERVLRGPVIARYTSFGSGGPDGARAAGLLFGVLATVRLAGLNPYTWMLDWLAACARHGNKAPQQLDPWLPWRLSEQRREQLSKAPLDWIPSVANSGDTELDKAA